MGGAIDLSENSDTQLANSGYQHEAANREGNLP